MCASRRPQTATYNDGPGRRESVNASQNPTASMEAFGAENVLDAILWIAPPHAVPMDLNFFRQHGPILSN